MTTLNTALSQKTPSQSHAPLSKTMDLADSSPQLHLFLPKDTRINGALSGKELENIAAKLDLLASVYGSDHPYGKDSLERIQNLYRFLMEKLSNNQLPPPVKEPLTARGKLVEIFSDKKFQATLAVCALISGIIGGFFALATLILVVCVSLLLLSGYVGCHVAAAATEHATWERAQTLRKIGEHLLPSNKPTREEEEEETSQISISQGSSESSIESLSSPDSTNSQF